MRPRDVARGARKMTRTVKGALVLASTTLACVVLIGVVHDQQVKERDALHQGVIRDKELWRRKVRERAGRGEPVAQTTKTVVGDLPELIGSPRHARDPQSAGMVE